MQAEEILSLSERVIALIESARQKVACTVNVAQVYTNYEIGRQIVEEEQGGKRRAGYGEKILTELSAKLTVRYGRGWSAENLKLIRRFYLVYSDLVNTVYPIGEDQDLVNKVYQIPRFALSWSHYLVLMRIADVEKREFYERAAIEGTWTQSQMSRQIATSYYERIVSSKAKDRAKHLLAKAPRQNAAEEPMKDPYVLEFLGLPDRHEYSESMLEQRIIDHLEEFMLELGKGFTFVARQSNIAFDEDHYRPTSCSTIV